MMRNARENRAPFALRDLEWVISSPFLLHDRPRTDLALDSETRALLARLLKDPALLLDHLAATPRLNLGRYFERLVIFWLSSLPSVKLLGSNIRIANDKRTLGELDLVFLHEGRVYHWELAVKFYLNIGDPLIEADYVGPMLKDTLIRKLDRLFSHQLALPEKPETSKTLAGLGAENITSAPFVKGCLFQAIANPEPEKRRPPRVAADSLTGGWLNLAQVESNCLPDFDHFRLLEKKRWITPYFYPAEAVKGGPAKLTSTLSRAFEQHPAPVLIALFRKEGSEKLTEAGRVFITPDDWLVLARKTHDGQELSD